MELRITAIVIACTLALTTVFLEVSDASGQSMADYTAYPAFTASAVPPNILLLMDNSGSMNSSAYHMSAVSSNGYTPNASELYSAIKTYYGYFDSTKCYTYANNKFSPAGNRSCSTGQWDGNFLNWLTMRRLEIVKWVMMGGKCAPRSINGTCYPGGTLVFEVPSGWDFAVVTAADGLSPYTGSRCFIRSGDTLTVKSSSTCSSTTAASFTLRTEITSEPQGIIQQVGSKARFGLMLFKDSGDGGKVLADVGGNIVSMVNAIENTDASTWTPLAESLYEATRYFAQVPPAYAKSDYPYTSQNRDPYYFQQPTWASTSQYVTCCKSFIIIFTDGQPTQDQNIPDPLKDYAHAAAGHGTDHHDTCSAYYGGASSDPCVSKGSHYLDDIAYYAHTTDLRQASLPTFNLDGSNATGKDLTGVQTLTIYTFLAFGTGSRILQEAAKMGGFEDRDAPGTSGYNRPDKQEEWDRVNNETGAAGADGIPDNYYESSDADKLHDRLLAAITSILQRSASGTSVSVLATSATGEGALYQAFFYPLIYEGLNQITWTGYTHGLFVDAFGNIREDTDGDARLVLTSDLIIKTRFDPATGDVKVDRYRDADGDAIADTTTPFESVTLRDIKPIWEAGKRLALTASSARNILTWVDSNNNGVVESGEQIQFSTANVTILSPYLRPGTAPFTASNIIDFIRGDQVPGMRDRQMTVDGALRVWKLGDPIDSTPTVVGPPKERYDVIYGDASYSAFYQHYRNRRQVAYVGGNDGMLHAFNAGFYHAGDDPSTPGVVERGYFTRNATDNSSGSALGQELWGFIPYQLLPHLQWLARTDYTHVYYVDLKPRVTDVRIFTPDADHPNGWGTILIGGMRFGGSCGACVAGTGAPPMTVTANFGSGTETRTFYSAYFVLDITNPERDPILLWSFTDSSLGLTTSYPTIVRANPPTSGKTDNAAAKWLMLVGSGPTGYDGGSAQSGKMFAIDLATGPGAGNSLIFTFSTSDANSFMGNLISVDIDLNYRADVVYIGNTISNGNNTPSWYGKLYRLTTGGGSTNLTSWGVASGANRVPTVLLATFPSTGSTKVGPVTAAPTVTADESGKLWVFFGTGRFYNNADKTNSDAQYFFGVKDPAVTGGSCQSADNACQRNNLLNVSNAVVCSVCSTGTNQVTGVSGVATFAELETKITPPLGSSQPEMDGWYTALPTSGERSLSTPTLLGGMVFFTTFIPANDICVFSGNGYVYALFYRTGSAYKESVIGTYTSGSNVNVSRSLSLGVGLPSQMAVQIGSQGTGISGSTGGSGCAGRVTGFIQASTGALNQFCGKPAIAPWSRLLSWLFSRD